MCWNMKSNVCEVMSWFSGTSVINHITVDQKDHFVKLTENLRWRLMNCWNDCSSCFGQLVQEADQVQGCCWVKTGRWLIQKDNRRVNQKLKTNWGSFLLTTWNTSDSVVPDVSVFTSSQTQKVYHFVDDFNFLLLSFLAQSYVSDEFESFIRSECGEHVILLHDVPKIVFVVVDVVCVLAVDFELAVDSQIFGQ